MPTVSVPSRPRAWPVLAAYLVAFVLALALSILFVFAVARLRSTGPRSRLLDDANDFAVSPAGLMSGALVNALVLGAVALVAAHLLGRPLAVRLRLGPSRASPVGMAAAAVGMVGLSFACGALGQLVKVPGGGVLDTMAHALASLSPLRFVLAVLTIGVAPGLAEEAFFRGLMQTRLVACWGAWPAIAATAAAFGLLHLDPVQGTLAFVAGLFLGWLAERFAGIRPTILAHVVNNAVFVTLASLGTTDDAGRWEHGAIAGGGAAVWAASLVVLRSSRAIRAETLETR